MMAKRVFLIVLDSCGCGEMPDSADFGDAGSNTLRACTASSRLDIPTLSKMGIFNIDSVDCGTPVPAPTAAYGRMAEKSRATSPIPAPRSSGTTAGSRRRPAG